MESLPDFDVRLLRTEGDVEDAPLFLLRDEEVDLYLQWLARDQRKPHEIQQLRKAYQSAMEDQKARRQGEDTELLKGLHWYAPMQKVVIGEDEGQVEQTFLDIGKDTLYRAEQLLRQQEKQAVYRSDVAGAGAGTMQPTLGAAAEVLYDLEGSKMARLPAGTTVGAKGVFVSKNAGPMSAMMGPGALLGVDARHPSPEVLAKWVRKEGLALLGQLGISDLPLDTYRALQALGPDEWVDADKEAEVPRERPEDAVAPRFQEQVPLGLSGDVAAWRDSARYDYRGTIYKPLTVKRPAFSDGNKEREEYGVTAGEIVGQYDVIREADPDRAILENLSELERLTLPFFQGVLRNLQMTPPTSEKLREVMEMGVRDVEWDSILEGLRAKLPPPALETAELEALLANPRLAIQMEVRTVVEGAALARKQALQRAVLQGLTFWSVQTALGLLETEGVRTFGTGAAAWSYGGFPLKKKERGLLDRVADVLHGSNKLPIASDSAGFLAREMRELYVTQFADHFAKKVEAVERKLKAEKSRLSEKLATALGTLVAAHRKRDTRDTAAALVQVLQMLPSLLQLEKLQNIREIESGWHAYSDFEQKNVKVLAQIYQIMKEVSKSIADGATEVAAASRATAAVTASAPAADAEEAGPSRAKIHAGVAKVPIADDLLLVPLRKHCEEEFPKVFGAGLGATLFGIWQRVPWNDGLRMLHLVPQFAQAEGLGELVGPMGKLLDAVEIRGDIYDVSVELRWKLGVLLLELVRFLDPKKAAVFGKQLQKKLDTVLELDRDILHTRIAKLREQMKKNMLEYLDRLSDEDKAAVRELKNLGLDVYKTGEGDHATYVRDGEGEGEAEVGDTGEGGDYEEYANEMFEEAA